MCFSVPVYRTGFSMAIVKCHTMMYLWVSECCDVFQCTNISYGFWYDHTKMPYMILRSIYRRKNRRVSRAFFFLFGCAKPRSYMVSTEIVALVTVSNGRIAAFVPDSLKRYGQCGRRKMSGRRVASASSIYSFCCCRPSLETSIVTSANLNRKSRE